MRELADVVEKKRNSKGTQLKRKPELIHFLREGETEGGKIPEKTSGILDQAGDWKLSVDLNQKLTFPEIVTTNLRPDMVIWSTGLKKIIIVELTVLGMRGAVKLMKGRSQV